MQLKIIILFFVILFSVLVYFNCVSCENKNIFYISKSNFVSQSQIKKNIISDEIISSTDDDLKLIIDETFDIIF